MQALPQVFDGVRFIEPDQSQLTTPEAIKRCDAVRDAFAEVKQAEQQLADAQAAVADAEKIVAAAEEVVKPFGPYDHFRLWQQSVKGI